MAASGVVPRAGTADTEAVLYTPYFDGYTTTYGQCDNIVLQAGPEPSYALARVPLNAIDDTAPAVAAVRTGPVGNGIRIGDNAWVNDGNGTRVIRGSVIEITHLLGDRDGEDAAIVKIEDARRKMKKFPIIGSFWRSGTGNGSIVYRQGWPPIFNQGAQPNCFFVGSVPVFCEPNYGLKAGQLPSAMDVKGTAACFWSNQTILAYLRYCACEGATLAGASFDYPTPISNVVNWPTGYASAMFPQVFVSSSSANNFSRKAPETNFDSMNLLDALTQALHAEGSWDLYITPYNYVTVVPTKYTNGGTSLYMPSGEATTEMAKPKIITGGVLVENGENLYKKAVSAGEITCIEERISTLSGGGLIYGWSDDDFDAFESLVTDYYNQHFGISEAVQMANSYYPNVLRRYRLDPDFNFQAGTPEATKPYARVGRPILETLLTSKLEGDNSATALYRFRYQTRFEYYADEESTPAWHQATLSDGMRLDMDGSIDLDGLYNAAQTYRLETSGFPPDATVTVIPRDLRVTVAIPCDHKLSAAALSPLGEEDRISPSLDDVYYASTNLYAREYRGGDHLSYPVPESANPDGTPPAPSGYLRNDIDYIRVHAARRADIYARLVRGGQFVCPYTSLAFDVGQQLGIFTGSRQGYPIRSVIRRIDIKSGPGEQSMIIHTDDAPFIGFDDAPQVTAQAVPPAAYTGGSSGASGGSTQTSGYTPAESSTPVTYRTEETNYGSTSGYGTAKSQAYNPNESGTGTTQDAPPGSVAAQKQQQAQQQANGSLADEDEERTGKGAAKDVEATKTATEGNQTLGGLVAEKTARDKAQAESEAGGGVIR